MTKPDREQISDHHFALLSGMAERKTKRINKEVKDARPSRSNRIAE